MAQRQEGTRAALKRKLSKLEKEFEKCHENATRRRAKIMKAAEKLERQLGAMKD